VDIDDGEKYYAQLRGFLEDQYHQKSAVITWLVPSPRHSSAQKGFDPSVYIAGFIHCCTLPLIQILYYLFTCSFDIILCWMAVTVLGVYLLIFCIYQ